MIGGVHLKRPIDKISEKHIVEEDPRVKERLLALIHLCVRKNCVGDI